MSAEFAVEGTRWANLNGSHRNHYAHRRPPRPRRPRLWGARMNHDTTKGA